jgi:hypothetical protein
VVSSLAIPCAERGTYKVSESLRSTHGQDGAVVLDVEQGRMFSLNRVGSRMLELMKSSAGEPEIVEIITQEFEIGREMVEKDLREFIAVLTRHNLIELSTRNRSDLSVPSV